MVHVSLTNMVLSRRTFCGSATFATLAANAHSATSRTGPDGMLLVNGKRTFLQGLYSLSNRPNPWRLAADAGFQVVHAVPDKRELDRARDHGLNVWLTTGSIAAARADEDRQRIAALVRAYRSHQSLLFWETEDEPAYQWNKPGPRVTPEVILRTAALIRQLDPDHALFLNHAPANLVSTLRQYNAASDIVGTDIYPVIPEKMPNMYGLWADGRQGDLLNTSISQVGQYMNKLRRVAGPSRCAVMVLQAFAWENLRDKDRNPALVLYPTREQLRFMAYHSIVRGANGLLWWGLHSTPPESPLWDDLAAVAREVGEVAPELTRPRTQIPVDLEYHDTGHSVDWGIEWLALPQPDGVRIIAVNADPNPVDITFRAPGVRPVRQRFAPFSVRLISAVRFR